MKWIGALWHSEPETIKPKDVPWIVLSLATKGRFLSESEIDISNCQTLMPNHYLKVEILKLSSITVKCCISVSVLNFIHQDVKSPNNVYLFWLLTTFVLSFVLSSNNKNSFAGLHASWKCQLCTDHAGGKIQMTKFKIVKQHICLAMKMSPIFFWLYPTFKNKVCTSIWARL